jgi:uncharacterized membrane protein
MTADAIARDSHLRSITKAITYRIVGTAATSAIAYLVTGSPHAAVAIGMIDPVVKIVVYYLHERVWLRF